MATSEPSSSAVDAPVPAIPCGEALRFWLKLGCISFGGPAGQIAIMHRELVERRRWISDARFLHALNYCMLLPGPEAQQLATYLGWLMHRSWGGIVAGALFVLPSLVLLIGLSALYVLWGGQPQVAGVFWGIQAAVAAIVLQAVWRLGQRTLRNPRTLPLPWAIALASFIAIALLQVPFPWVIGAAALLGWAGARRGWMGAAGSAATSHSGAGSAATPHSAAGSAAASHPPALIDDHTPPPAHARFSRTRLVAVVFIGLLLWAVTLGALVLAFGTDSALVQMGRFFTQTALLTFGGAYAVLPYVMQGAVEQYQWLSAAQMMDGLALGETTPGPLIMVVAFVGYLGGWSQQVLGPEARLAGAALAACVATWFTFLPSFVFILAGGPLVESTRGRLGFTAPLAAITAAVVGVIASLGLFFVAQVARDAAGQIDVPALLLMGVAAGLLLRGRWGVIPVIALCAAVGGLLSWARL
ncbi:MAG: chromate efflux transporter [Burkholderiaceae bacterium]